MPLLAAVLAQSGLIAPANVTFQEVIQGTGLLTLLWIGRSASQMRDAVLEMKQTLYAKKTGLVDAVDELQVWKETHNVEAGRAMQELDRVVDAVDVKIPAEIAQLRSVLNTPHVEAKL